MKFMTVLAALLTLVFIHPAQANHRHHHRQHRHYSRVVARDPATIVCNRQGCNDRREYHKSTVATRVARGARQLSDMVFIPNPPGTWRVFNSCAHRLAAYWHLGPGLDSVSEWPHRFQRAGGPGVGIAAVRRDRHHVRGIIGGGPGAWRVVDFNSGGHRNREYTIADFHGYFFVDPRSRVAQGY